MLTRHQKTGQKAWKRVLPAQKLQALEICNLHLQGKKKKFRRLKPKPLYKYGQERT
jgi:hypothetical protein